MIPIKLSVYNPTQGEWITKEIWEIFEPDRAWSLLTEEQCIAEAYRSKMYPSEVKEVSETYCRDSDRTANYELEKILNVNAKAKPEFTWTMLKAIYVQRLLAFLLFTYDYKDSQGVIVPVEAPKIRVTYMDFIGMRTIEAYLGATIEGTLEEYDGVQYWESFRIAFPER